MNQSNSLDKLRALAAKEKHKQSRQQIPKRNAPNVSDSEHIFIAGAVFKKIKQDKKGLTIQVDGQSISNSPMNMVQICSYVLTTNRVISAGGWDWRPYRTKSNGRIMFKPIAPTEIVL